MASPTPSPPTFQEDWTLIKGVGWAIAIFATLIIGIPANGFQAAILMALNPDLAGTEGVLTLGQVMSLTAPLTLAVAIIVFGLVFPFLRSNIDLTYQGSLIAGGIAAGVFGLTAVVFDLLGLAAEGVGIEEVQKKAELAVRHGPTPQYESLIFIGQMLALYYEAYHPSFFFSSLITGVFLGWALDRMLPHVIKRIRSS